MDEPLKEPKVEIEDAGLPVKIGRRSSKKHRENEECYSETASSKERRVGGTLLALHKPSYCLKKGIGSTQCVSESLRTWHRRNLWRIFEKLIRRHNWEEASGVLSVLLQATVHDDSIEGNRAKYSAALELLTYIKGETLNSRRIQSVYELWMKKLGLLKYLPPKDRFAVQLEYILSCLQRGSLEDAHQAAISIMQEPGFSSDPRANFVVGLAFCRLWYSGLPKELQLTEFDSSSIYTQSEVPFTGMHIPVDYSKDNEAAMPGEGSSALPCGSNTSIAFDKIPKYDHSRLEDPMDLDAEVKKEVSNTSFQLLQDYTESAEASDHLESLSNYEEDLPQVSIFYTKGLPPWLCPLKFPSTDENFEDVVHAHRKFQDSRYKSALKHLRVALHATPPVAEALHPLIQMLLLGDRVLEAFDELENLFPGSNTPLQLRMKASLLEHFDSENCAKLCTCFEDILKKDPTCSHSLQRLVIMHQRGIITMRIRHTQFGGNDGLTFRCIPRHIRHMEGVSNMLFETFSV
ncbi:uncharacterized protein LOC127265075 isoform X2 [Andrographis paniculata]|uniref:uncharacterized protein LOC127265075 isoform X2 n=1 Tax=Andrographis paniculata TaxID=175694 RepID=UPI0021E877A6|nr:uncharacterized protein LOC127265075 isoform X2 [Andrographis paniculata]